MELLLVPRKVQRFYNLTRVGFPPSSFPYFYINSIHVPISNERNSSLRNVRLLTVSHLTLWSFTYPVYSSSLEGMGHNYFVCFGRFHKPGPVFRPTHIGDTVPGAPDVQAVLNRSAPNVLLLRTHLHYC